MAVAVTAPPLTSSRANHKAKLLLSPVFGESVGAAVSFVPVPPLASLGTSICAGTFLLH